MDMLSVNGQLSPISSNSNELANSYQGHFVKIAFSREISGQAVFSKDRAEVNANGEFRFFVPPASLVVDQAVTIEVYAPSGELLAKLYVSHGSLNAADIKLTAADNSQAFEIKVDPKLISVGDISPVAEQVIKVKGRVVDVSGNGKNVGLQVLIFTTQGSESAFSIGSFQAVASAKTDKSGYFYCSLANQVVSSAYGVIAGMESEPIAIPLEDSRVPSSVILVADLATFDEDKGCGCDTEVESQPDNADLVNSSAFSQDVGGKCIDFTVPNRTLEEFSFYQTVRTTEPEIRGLTITASETDKVRDQLALHSEHAFDLVAKLNASFSSMSLLAFSVQEDQEDNGTAKPAEPIEDGNAIKSRAEGDSKGHGISAKMAQRVSKIPINTRRNYVLNLDIGQRTPLVLNSLDITAPDMRFDYQDIIQLIIAQNKRKQKLKELEMKLAAAYCGKNGVQEEQSFCQKLAVHTSIEGEKLNALLAQVTKDVQRVRLDADTARHLRKVMIDIEALANGTTVDSKQIKQIGAQLDKVVTLVEKQVPDGDGKEILLANLRRMALELANNLNNQSLPFEPCPLKPVRETMGIICLMQKYQDIRNLLANTRILSLPEIVEIKAYYQVFIDSINGFVRLLDEYYHFYNSGVSFGMELIDKYFYDNYDEIKSTLTHLVREIQSSHRYVLALERAYIRNHPGRQELSVETSIDWDETPTIYENTTIAHGHILHFKQQWKADGYSLGDLLYSLPLAPCQEKRISILDWDRSEQASREESTLATESLTANIERDRDITEIMSANLNENMQASSSNRTKSSSGGIGGGIGGFFKGIVFGVAGGVAHSGANSSSSASQSSSRNLASSALNRLQDSTSQSASSLRSQRNTVVQTVGQQEDVRAQTEVVKNNNHCHAMTVEYFEVLKHYAVEQNLVDVQECLFVPMPMSHFDHQKVLRWRHTLQRFMYGRKLLKGFDAIDRIETNYVNVDLPAGSHADEVIQAFSGYMTLSFELARPFTPAIDTALKMEEYDLTIDFPWFNKKMIISLERPVPLTDQEKDAIFEEQYAPDIVRQFVDTLSLYAVSDLGTLQLLNIDLTLLSTYRKGVPLRIGFASAGTGTVTRRQIQHLVVAASTSVKSTSKIILRSMHLGYQTKYLRDYITRNHRINNDILYNQGPLGPFVPPYIAELLNMGPTSDAAQIYTPLSNRELSNPRKEDQDAASALIQYLNEHMELAHKVIWSNIDASRLFGLLDGYLAPNSSGRSVASVVENKVMGIVGNNLVLKVIPGERLDPVFRGVQDLLAYYQPTTPLDPYRISVPTKGVYAESVMGQCNSCETIDESRHWRFDEVPCCGDAPEIGALDTGSRRAEPGNLQAKDLPENLINIQTAAEAPAPTSLSEAYKLLGQGDVFSDITGLEGTQKNALGALNTTAKQATDMASISKDFASLSVMANQKRDGAKQIDQIKKLHKEGYLNDADATEQIKEVLKSFNAAAKNVTQSKEEGKESAADKIANKVVESGLNADAKDVVYSKTKADGETESIKVTKGEKEQSSDNDSGDTGNNGDSSGDTDN
ncbi:hypothetical protein DXX93_04555 [Thalassotalea euphylliae]|uniref:Uncharacterized protein n=1 Tax=Thalassotalea euphylliae TaxID=1655234 RepID=A0A3E0TMY7_9GAMM|nr:hypothetical protein [Thalassotalea euphylliae]REL25906.1 hypothetical protein DXX93_04555 [Thalassotalea euphylliae]